MKDSAAQGTFTIDLEPVWLAADPGAGFDVAALGPAENLQDAGRGAAGSVFDEGARGRVSAMASRNKLPLPDYSFSQSGRNTPAILRKFIGIWTSVKASTVDRSTP